MSRIAHQPDPALRRQVETLAGYGIPEIGIARVIGIDPKTLRKHYRNELDLGHIKTNSAVAQSLFRKATGDGPQAVTAAIFWAKTRMGWKETVVNEHGGIPGSPLDVVTTIILRGVDPEPRPMTGLARLESPFPATRRNGAKFSED